jgi:hypothetical protein
MTFLPKLHMAWCLYQIVRSGLISSRGFSLARNCRPRLACISRKTLPCSIGFITLNGDGLCPAEPIMSSPSYGTSITSFLCTPIGLKSPSHGKYECPLVGKTWVTTSTIFNIWPSHVRAEPLRDFYFILENHQKTATVPMCL